MIEILIDIFGYRFRWYIRENVHWNLFVMHLQQIRWWFKISVAFCVDHFSMSIDGNKKATTYDSLFKPEFSSCLDPTTVRKANHQMMWIKLSWMSRRRNQMNLNYIFMVRDIVASERVETLFHIKIAMSRDLLRLQRLRIKSFNFQSWWFCVIGSSENEMKWAQRGTESMAEFKMGIHFIAFGLWDIYRVNNSFSHSFDETMQNVKRPGLVQLWN